MELEPKEIQAVQGSFLLADIPPHQAALFAAWGDKQLFEDGQTIYSTGRGRANLQPFRSAAERFGPWRLFWRSRPIQPFPTVCQ